MIVVMKFVKILAERQKSNDDVGTRREFRKFVARGLSATKVRKEDEGE